jgi:hypothetical protein
VLGQPVQSVWLRSDSRSAGAVHSYRDRESTRLRHPHRQCNPVLGQVWIDYPAPSSPNGMLSGSLNPDPLDVRPMAPPVDVNFTQLSSGSADTCGVTTASTITCFGLTPSLAAGASDANAQYGPVFVHVSVGNNHACAVTVDRRLICWVRQLCTPMS